MSESNGHIPAGDLLRAELAQGRRRLDAMESQMLFWRSVAGILTAAGGGGDPDPAPPAPAGGDDAS